ncbi:NAD(P)-binding protein [Cylindrobasidium torrendii FP15055 ss-10]|uniref:NAD(P)-binding protein n=1 Tax=Cylindrobasidium torrendii FP15055 ss-10 TaxID=1314674 RepID=A0A0D7BUI3_9AGAR|nr:NAD(P)-binding protein [Cylindrobasidium torrendii FP15055 ss-10]
MQLYLNGIALVVGAGQGIGKATALAYAEAGVRGIVLAGRTLEPLLKAGEDCKAIATHKDFEAYAVPTDIANEDSVKNLLAKAVEKFGRVDYCANVGGTMGMKAKFSTIATEDWLSVQQTNINGIFWLVREQIRVMEKQERLETPISSERRPAERGSIVVLSAAAAIIALQNGGAYTHTKYATNGLTKAAAQDHAANGIRINAILPGYILTEGLAAHPQKTAETAKHIIEASPLHRFGCAEEVGDMIVMMSSPRNGYMIGSSVLVDGGQNLSGEAVH